MTKFSQGIQYFNEKLPYFDEYGQKPAIAEGQKAIASSTD